MGPNGKKTPLRISAPGRNSGTRAVALDRYPKMSRHVSRRFSKFRQGAPQIDFEKKFLFSLSRKRLELERSFLNPRCSLGMPVTYPNHQCVRHFRSEILTIFVSKSRKNKARNLELARNNFVSFFICYADLHAESIKGKKNST